MSVATAGESSGTSVGSYRNYAREARELVVEVLQQALRTHEDQFVEWPTGDTFTIELAKETIDKLVKAREQMIYH